MKFGISVFALWAIADQTSAANLKKKGNRGLLLERKLTSNPILSGGANPKVTFQPGCFDWGKHIRE